jgi:hypothetical protein
MRGWWIVPALLLAACGKQGPLGPVAPRPAPQKPATMARAPTPQQMLKLDTQALPARVDDANGPLPERGNDPFNLPPPQP